jgi:hypothetical protein
MKRTKIVLLVAAISFLLTAGGVIVATSMNPSAAQAQGEQERIGRYQLSSWAAYSGERIHHSGYYVLDTVTGKIVDRGHEIHGITSGPGAKEE